MPFDFLCKSKIFKNVSSYEDIKIDKYANELFSSVFTGMGGRYTRLRILCAIVEVSMNSFQISKSLNLDPKTVSYNLKVLRKHNLVAREGDGYGDLYSPAEIVKSNLPTLYAVIRKVESKLDDWEKNYID